MLIYSVVHIFDTTGSFIIVEDVITSLENQKFQAYRA